MGINCLMVVRVSVSGDGKILVIYSGYGCIIFLM